jgi:hypothetical protein
MRGRRETRGECDRTKEDGGKKKENLSKKVN